MDTPALSFRNVSKTYTRSSGSELQALQKVNIDILRGRKVAITGRSGSGKSTFLSLAAGIDRPTQGTVCVLGRDLSTLSDRELTLQRRNSIGLVFQFFHLLPHLSVLENVFLPAWISGDSSKLFEPRAQELLARVGLHDRSDDAVHKLSGGEMQRVALCRALLRRPPLLLADEPTGNLDDDSGRIVMDLLVQLASEEGATLIYVTHSLELASLADQTLRLHSGILDTP